MRVAALLYGVACYAAFVASFVAAVGFLTGVGPLPNIDRAASISVVPALFVDLALLLLFGLQHSVMARQRFKRLWARLVPQAIERSTYTLLSSLALIAMVHWWQPIEPLLWDVQVGWARAAVFALLGSGLVLTLVGTTLTDHLDLFGLRQVLLFWRGRPYAPPPFVPGSLYRLCRHPMMLGILVAFWAAPRMMVGHALFSGGMTVYIAVGIALEERDLRRQFGDAYAEYVRAVPMLLPVRRRRTRRER